VPAHPTLSAERYAPGMTSKPTIGRATFVLECMATLLANEDLTHAATALTSDLAVRFHCDRVTLACMQRGMLKMVAISHRSGLTTTSSLHQDILSAMDEALAQSAVIVFPPPDDDQPRITLGHAALARQHGATHICSVPMMREGKVLGVLTLERSEAIDANARANLELLGGLLAPLIELKRLQLRGPWERVCDDARKSAGRLVGPTHLGIKATVALAISVGVALALYPVEHRVTATARIEGLVQRVVVAPVDGFLKSTHVRPGDSVEAGALLAEMRDDDLKLHERKWIGELAQRESTYSEALAKLNRPQLVTSHALIGEARAQLELVEQQIIRTQLKAPISGIVIKGDLSQWLGAPVKRGEALLTIAPRTDRRVIVEVDERDIGKVRRGQAGFLTLAAMPGAPIPVSLIRVTPVAVVANGTNAFEVEAEITHRAQTLQPGMRGVAKIAVGTESALWVLCHRALDWLRLTWWLWVG
jgi:multidrug efflux pump subunit AcrA (membrane-fusion protein)